jgi:hypothetical protein
MFSKLFNKEKGKIVEELVKVKFMGKVEDTF